MLVANTASNIVHSVLIDTDEDIPVDASVTFCGWRYALTGAFPYRRVPGASSLPSFCRTCKKREAGDDSDASSEQPEEDATPDFAAVEEDDIYDV